MAEAKKKCTKKTKAGKACRAWALHGLDVCMAHADEETRAKAGFGGAENGAKGGEAKRQPRFTEMLRDQVAAEVEDFFAPFREGLKATRHIVVGTGPKARLEEVPDIPTRMAAMDKLLDRIDGRPKQTTELTGEDGGPIETRELIPGDANFHTQVAEVLREAEAITAG